MSPDSVIKFISSTNIKHWIKKYSVPVEFYLFTHILVITLKILLMSKYEYIVTINKGIEEIAAREVYTLLGRKPVIGDNILRVKGTVEDAYKLIIWGRTFHRVLLLIDEGEFKDLEDLKNKISRLDFKEYFKKGSKFALKTNRYGIHTFTSIDANKVVGGAIHDVLMEKNLDPQVDLKNPDIQFILRIVDDRYMLTINLVGESLHARNYRVYNHPASIKTSLAAAMILLSGWGDEDFIDPMGGGGTIPIEASMIKYRYAPGLYRSFHPLINIPIFNSSDYHRFREDAIYMRINNKLDVSIVYNDVSRRHYEGAILNSKSAGVDKYIDFYNYDARRLSKYGFKLRNGFITVSNPPYGIRMTRHKVIPELYMEVVRELVGLGCKKFVMITSAWKSLLNAFEENNVKLVRKYQIKHGRLDTFILYGVA